MVLWLAKNPAKKPKNAIRFIENWLKRVQADAVRDLAETGKRAQVTAERVGSMYQVTPRPGELQEHFNRRVIAAASMSIVKRVA
jgi:pyrrolidone-carboxylate peptidase